MEIRKFVVPAVLLAVGLSIFFIIGGLKLAIVYAMLWIDKVVIGKLKVPMEFGIELFSLPAILVGIIYGPAIGFIFGFLIIPLIGGIIDVISSLILGSQLLDTGWEPFVPSPDSLISGAIAVVGGLISPFLPFFFIVLVCIIIRFIVSVVKDIMMGNPPKIIAYIINLVLNLFIAFSLQAFFTSIFLI